MGLFNAVNIQNDTVAVLSIRKKRNTYEVLENQLLDPSELTHYLADKSAFHVCIDQDDVLNEKITIPTAIKKDNVIKNMILRKFNDIIQGRKVLLNYHELSKNQNNDTTTYHVDGVYEDDYVQTLHTLGKWNEIKSATASRFALFGLSDQCIKEESYLSVHTQGSKVDILAVHKGIPIFNRVGIIMADDEEKRQIAIANEISSTITYINQQCNDIKFSTIALSGSVAMDDMVPEHLSILTQIPVTVLYPNTFMLGLSNEKAQHSILALGSYFVPKSCQFLPDSLINVRQYLLSQNMLLIASIIIFLPIFFFTYEKYESYNNALDQYASIKDQLIQTVRNTETYSQEELQKSWDYLQISQKHLRHHPSDLFLALKPLVMLQKPEEWSWKYHEDQPELSVSFAKPFKSLDALHQFEKRFQKQFNKINSKLSLTFLDKTDYAKMQFKATVSIVKAKETLQKRIKRRR